MRYAYVRSFLDNTQQKLDEYAAAGWTVHTFNRVPTSNIVDILFQKETS